VRSSDEEFIEIDYFSAVPDWPNFAILADTISGRIPVTKIARWKDLTELLE
jgi:hypothetical protein